MTYGNVYQVDISSIQVYNVLAVLSVVQIAPGFSLKDISAGRHMQGKFQLSEKEFSLFCEVITSFHTIHDTEEMFLVIFQKIKSVFNIDGTSLALHDPVRKEFYFIRTVEDAHEIRSAGDLPWRFPDHKGIAGWVMEQNRTDFINDVSKDPRYFDGMNTKNDFVTKSMICAPLRTRKGFLGVLYALNKRSGVFSERDARIFEILSGTIAVSLENALFYEELKDNLYALEREKRLLLSQVGVESGFKEIIGSSPAMRQMFELINKILDTSTSVLIQGETGTGKELIARVIHFNGPLKDKTFVAENCAALPENLLESELFGHVKGAFTGAIANKKGLFEIADGGTIFLDEIGEVPPSMQVKLLRVIQEGQFRPVGSSQTRQVNVRLIVSTNRNLAEEIEKGNFREDLYYRINVFQITPPPLRERKEDILPLAKHFLAKFADKIDKPVPSLQPEVLRLLVKFNWPGNVRELENEMERVVAMAAGAEEIAKEFLSDKLVGTDTERYAKKSEIASGALKDVLRQVEEQMIREALETTAGNRSKAAKLLGLSRQGLLNKIAAYHVQK